MSNEHNENEATKPHGLPEVGDVWEWNGGGRMTIHKVVDHAEYGMGDKFSVCYVMASGQRGDMLWKYFRMCAFPLRILADDPNRIHWAMTRDMDQTT